MRAQKERSTLLRVKRHSAAIGALCLRSSSVTGVGSLEGKTSFLSSTRQTWSVDSRLHHTAGAGAEWETKSCMDQAGSSR